MERFMKKLSAILMTAVIVTGCEYIPRKVIEIQTKDGSTVKFLCPVVDPNRSTMTYIIEGDCVVIK
jgi:hypothetical protein